jgi:hypothetical protein
MMSQKTLHFQKRGKMGTWQRPFLYIYNIINPTVLGFICTLYIYNSPLDVWGTTSGAAGGIKSGSPTVKGAMLIYF